MFKAMGETSDLPFIKKFGNSIKIFLFGNTEILLKEKYIKILENETAEIKNMEITFYF